MELFEVEESNRDLLTRVRVHRQPPEHWAALIGDAVHNLRAAFDHIAWQAVLADGGTPRRSTEYPFVDKAEQLGKALRDDLRGTSVTFRELVRQTAPHPPADLWLVHRLDVVDKHHTLLPVGAAHTGVDVTMKTPLPEGFGPMEWPTITLRPDDLQYPLQDGAEVFRVLAGGRDGYVPEHAMRFDVVFGPDVPQVHGQPVVDVLRRLYDAAVSAADPLLAYLDARRADLRPAVE